MIRFRLRFSLRTLAIVVTLVCAYFGAWDQATKRYGIEKTFDHHGWTTTYIGSEQRQVVRASAPIPFLLRCKEFGSEEEIRMVQHYYLWLFGPTFKLPFESTWDDR